MCEIIRNADPRRWTARSIAAENAWTEWTARAAARGACTLCAIARMLTRMPRHTPAPSEPPPRRTITLHAYGETFEIPEPSGTATQVAAAIAKEMRARGIRVKRRGAALTPLPSLIAGTVTITRLRARGETRNTLSAKPVLRLQLFGVCKRTLTHLRRDFVALRRDVAALGYSARRQRFDLSYSAPLGSTEAEQTQGAAAVLEPARRWIRGALLERLTGG